MISERITSMQRRQGEEKGKEKASDVKVAIICSAPQDRMITVTISRQ